MAVYIPPLFSVGILNEIMEKTIQYLPEKLLLTGDFNSVLSPDLERPKPPPPKQYAADLYNWAQLTGLTEKKKKLTPVFPPLIKQHLE